MRPGGAYAPAHVNTAHAGIPEWVRKKPPERAIPNTRWPRYSSCMAATAESIRRKLQTAVGESHMATQTQAGVSVVTVVYTDKGREKSIDIPLDPAKCQHAVKARYAADKSTCVRPPRQCSIARMVEDDSGERSLNPLWALRGGKPTDGCNYHVKDRDVAHREGKSLVSGARVHGTAAPVANPADLAAVADLRAMVEAQNAQIEKLLALATATTARASSVKGRAA